MADRAQKETEELVEAGEATPLGPDDVPAEVLATPEEGLEHIPQPGKRVIIVGGGIAGLVAAFELVRQGHEPLILEAQHRVGGRVYTIRDFAPGLYAEGGAMRIPRVHDLTLKYCDLFDLELRPFIMGNPKGLVYVGGQRMTAEECEQEPSKLPFELADHERGKHVNKLWDAAVADLVELLEREGERGWDLMAQEYDQYSIREFLQLKGFSEGAIEAYGVINFIEADLNNAVMELFREELGKAFVDMQEIVGGMDLLPQAFYGHLQPYVRFGAEVTAIDQDEHAVTVHYKTLGGRFSVTGDYAVCAVPFSVLRHIEIMKPFSREKQKAIRQLNYSASTKVLLQTRTRFWEEEDGIYGGATATDLPIRRMNYPTPDPTTERGVLLGSYTWAQDASRWGSMDDETRIEQCIEDVAQIHPRIKDEFEVGASQAWYSDRFAGGAFALFAPEQLSELQAGIVSPEGRIYFAGEHCSLWHAWIQGALESGIRAAREIHEAPSVMSATPR